MPPTANARNSPATPKPPSEYAHTVAAQGAHAYRAARTYRAASHHHVHGESQKADPQDLRRTRGIVSPSGQMTGPHDPEFLTREIVDAIHEEQLKVLEAFTAFGMKTPSSRL